MSLKSELAEMKDQLAALKERIEADDAEAIEEGAKLAEDIEAKEAEIEQAEKKTAVLGKIGKKEEDNPMGEKKGLQALELGGLKAAPGAVSTYIKAATDVETAPQIADTSRIVQMPPASRRVRDLFGAESISGNALTYYVLGATEGEPAVTAQGAKKPQIHVPYTPVTAALAKIAAYFKETDELLSDAAFLDTAVRNRGVFEFEKAVDAYLVTTLMATSGVQTGGDSITFDTILAAKQDISADTGYTPDAMLINPADLATLLQTKDGNLQYLLGGPAYGSYGNGAYSANPRIWGMEVVESSAVPAGQVIVGAFRAGAAVITKTDEGRRVEVSNSNEDDFVYNRVTVRIEERMVEAVRVPAAFSIVGTAS